MVTTTLAGMARSTQQQARDGLQSLVEGLTTDPDTALARIWLLQTESACDICRQHHSEWSAGELGLHLAASAGRSRTSGPPQTWDRLDGMSHRFPLRSQKIGQIGATGEPLIVRQTSGDSSLTNQQWLAQEGIQSFFGYPIADGERIFGVLGVFLRRELTEFDLNYLRQIANLSARQILHAERLNELQFRIRVLTAESSALGRRSELDRGWGTPVCSTPASRKWDEQIRLAARHRSTVLICGERGSGKEYTARRIHALSEAAQAPFLVVHGKDLDIDFLEEQLRAPNSPSVTATASLNHDKAVCGTLLIESIEQTSAEVQRWLTQYLGQQHDQLSLPGNAPDQFRLIAESSVDLNHEVSSGRLQNELYCALSITEIHVPPLRARIDDLPGLARGMIEKFCEREHRTTLEIPQRLLSAWKQAEWPGNVRELELVLTRCLWRAGENETEIREVEEMIAPELDPPSVILRAQDLKRNEKANLLACLKQCDWKVYGTGGAAEMLGMKPTTLIYRMKILGIRRPSR